VFIIRQQRMACCSILKRSPREGLLQIASKLWIYCTFIHQACF